MKMRIRLKLFSYLSFSFIFFALNANSSAELIVKQCSFDFRLGSQSKLIKTGLKPEKIFITGQKFWKKNEYHESHIYYENEKIGIVWIGIVNDELRFDIKLLPKYQGKNLYAYLMDEVVREFPDINSISSIMTSKNSDNAKIFFNKINEDVLRALNHKRFLNWKHQRLLKLKEQAVFAFMETPAYKARAALGYKKIDIIALSSDPKQNLRGLRFKVSKGSNVSMEDIKFYLRDTDSNYYLIGDDSQLEEVGTIWKFFNKDYMYGREIGDKYPHFIHK